MIKGFITGSLALIVLYVVVQPGPSQKLGLASNTLVASMRRLFEPDVAGIGDHSGFTTSITPINPSTSGGGAVPKFTSLDNPYGTTGINGTNPQWITAADYFSKLN